MSDRPMRLKYLTKMKIILCIFLLYITAVSVFGEPQELNGILGESVKFPAAVKIEGSWMYSGVPIGIVTSGRFTPPRDGGYSGRVQWDSSTGLFSLSGLKMEDSGVYTVQNTHQDINTVFQLNVYIPVSKPHLSVTHNEYRCTVLCAAARGTGATLTLYREGETNPYVTSPGHSHPDLDMTVPVESGTYTCEAKNSVSRETSDPLTVGAHCTAPVAERELNSILAGSVKFPAAVKINGILMHSGVPIGDVTKGSFKTPRNSEYNGRVQWDSSTEYFSLSGLKMEDSGEYEVQNTDQNINTVFQLNVYIPVSKPHLSVTHNEYRCTVLCAAARGTGATLTLYREGEKNPYVTSPGHSHPDLDMTETVESGTYTCEAKNSVSRETSDPLTVGAHCTAPAGPNALAIVFGISAVVALFAAGFFAYKYCRIRSKRPGEDMLALPPDGLLGLSK